MADNSEAYAFRLLPRWMRGDWADRLWTVIFGSVDGIRESAKEAAKAGLVTECPADALPYHAAARNIERIPGETDDAWRLRLQAAWDHWPSTKAELQQILRDYVQVDELYVYDIAGDAWTDGSTGTMDDANGDNWSRPWIVIGAPHPWTVPTFGSFSFGPDSLWGITMTGTELSRIRRLFRRYRPAHVTGGEVFVLMDAGLPSDTLARHDFNDHVRMPLQLQMFGYPGAYFGAFAFGKEFT